MSDVIHSQEKWKEVALAEMKKLAECDDYEYGHSRADDILCELLVQLGGEDIVDAYVKVHKWYA